jgi:competence protein ComEA
MLLALCLFTHFAVSLEPQTAKLPDGPGKATFQRICSGCHPAQIVIGRKLSRDGWEQVVSDMVQKGATGTDDEFDQIIEYLAANFSNAPSDAKLNVNKAPANELASGLDISVDEAASIVQYRQTKGAFKSIDDLKKVPGLDARKVDAKKSALVF